MRRTFTLIRTDTNTSAHGRAQTQSRHKQLESILVSHKSGFLNDAWFFLPYFSISVSIFYLSLAVIHMTHYNLERKRFLTLLFFSITEMLLLCERRVWFKLWCSIVMRNPAMEADEVVLMYNWYKNKIKNTNEHHLPIPRKLMKIAVRVGLAIVGLIVGLTVRWPAVVLLTWFIVLSIVKPLLTSDFVTVLAF